MTSPEAPFGSANQSDHGKSLTLKVVRMGPADQSAIAPRSPGFFTSGITQTAVGHGGSLRVPGLLVP